MLVWCLAVAETPAAPGSAAAAPLQGGRSAVPTTADYLFVAASDAKYRGAPGGSSAVHSIGFGASTTIPLNEHWFVPLGLNSGNLYLEAVNGIPIPEQAHTLRLSAGVGYRFNQRWSVSASASPALYKLHDLGGNDIGISGLAYAVFQARPELTLSFGLGANPDSDVPVIPMIGARWDIRDDLTLNLVFPRPMLVYRASGKLNLYAGGDIRFSVFRSEDNLGDEIGDARFNDALARYRDFHFGLGAEYQVVRSFWVSLEGGYSFGRQIDYKHVDRTVKFDPAPYGKLSVRYRF